MQRIPCPDMRNLDQSVMSIMKSHFSLRLDILPQQIQLMQVPPDVTFQRRMDTGSSGQGRDLGPSSPAAQQPAQHAQSTAACHSARTGPVRLEKLSAQSIPRLRSLNSTTAGNPKGHHQRPTTNELQLYATIPRCSITNKQSRNQLRQT
jgi:hypothetical protein